ncbi:KpsF/GutQ family sugar-phosphate isomerase [Salmonella enterica subsp. enterica serovar Newport]|nr:KpsF/GutQ family sugar-phosphate isomerase [Salmonella enterica subsp. enterica serovar Newport]
MPSEIHDASEGIITQARSVLACEAQSLLDAIPAIGTAFVRTVNLITETRGRVIVTGMGKPGYVAHKISATLASTGTPSFYLHPAEAAHGDLGMVTSSDVMLVLSNSGETLEILAMLPALKRIGVPVIALCGNAGSTLVAHSDVFLSSAVKRECCPLNLAPTNSTTLSLALGDAIAVALMNIRQFRKEDFALYHPGGALGKRLLTTVRDIMKSGEACCAVEQSTSILNTLFTMTSCKAGAATVINEQNELAGIVTDGDIRRYVMYNNLFLDNPVTEVMTTSPAWVYEDELVEAAIRKMSENVPSPVTVLPVLNRDKKVTGLLNVADLFNNRLL